MKKIFFALSLVLSTAAFADQNNKNAMMEEKLSYKREMLTLEEDNHDTRIQKIEDYYQTSLINLAAIKASDLKREDKNHARALKEFNALVDKSDYKSKRITDETSRHQAEKTRLNAYFNARELEIEAEYQRKKDIEETRSEKVTVRLKAEITKLEAKYGSIQ